ncbi:large ribosomal subunit protein bL21m-like isoform X1 [Apostichopus japonicus]|uniref:large ribosomal subunit protein bL21m-like isoform X1 n=1 Tax=Stichopus japonicus TaxID=307972 RepID=UPI003AB22DA4
MLYYSFASVVPTHIASQVKCKRIQLSSRNLLRSYSSEVLVPFAHRHEVIKDVNEEIKMDIGRVFAVVLIGGSQFKVTAEDLIQFVGHVEADVGERIRLEKVLLVGGDNFSVIGKPLLSSDMVRIEATVVEKTLSEKKILFRFKRRMNYKRYKEMWAPLTVLRINTIEVNAVLS